MPDQTSKGPSYVSDGVYFGIREYGSSAAFTDVGVMENGFTSTIQSASSSKEFGNRENAAPVAKNQKIQIAPTQIYTIENATIALLSGGLITETVIAGTPVSGGEQTIDSGSWDYSEGIELTGKESDGSLPTINSVTGGTDGALVLNTDYTLTKVDGGWNIAILDSTTVTTTAQDIVVDSDYTPAASSTLYSGNSSTEITPIEVRIRHYTDSALSITDYDLNIFRGFVDAGSLVFTKNGARSDTDYDSFSLTITGETDASRDAGKQLYSENRA